MDIPNLDPAQWEEVTFPRHPDSDSLWTIVLGPDQNVYLGLCLEASGGGIAQFYQYDTRAREMRHLADMEQVTGQRADDGHAPQGKIHFSLCPARSGMVYGATHATTPPMGEKIWSVISMWDDPVRSFPGAHMFRHNLATGETVDFGIITPNEGIPYLMLDESRERLYGLTYPRAHLFRTNLLGRDFHDYGRVSAHYPICMIFDHEGNLWTSDWASKLVKLEVATDEVRFFDSKPYSDPWNLTGRCSPITDMIYGPDERIYGANYCNDHLWRFDPREQVPQVEDLGPGIPEARATGLRSLMCDRQGRIYFATYGTAEGPVLARYNPTTDEREILGRMELRGRVFSSWRGVCDAEGTLYLGGGRPVTIFIGRGLTE